MTASSQAVELLEVQERVGGNGRPSGSLLAARRTRGILGAHWLFVLFLMLGVGMRVIVTLAYWPALELLGDSYDYLGTAVVLRPSPWHPAVYPLFLRALFPAGNLGVVTILQHLMGLGLGVLLYALLLRHGVRPWLAALGALPVLLDAYQLEIEQYVLAETLTDVLLVGGLALLLWRRRLTAPFAAAAGVLLALAALSREAALPVVVVVAVYLLVRRWWRALLSFGGAAAAILVAYGFWYLSAWGSFALGAYSGPTLYGRVAPFATCNYPLSPQERKLCPTQPVSQRPYNVDYYIWLGGPLHQPGLGSQQARFALAKSFSEQVVLHQPHAYLDAVWQDTWHYFTPGRSVAPNANIPDFRRWVFPGPNLRPYSGVEVNGHLEALHVFFANVGLNNRPVHHRLHPSLMGPLRAYQRVAYTQGPLLLACLVGAVLVSLPLLGSGARRRQARWAALLLAASGVALVVGASATIGFSYRYQLPLLVLLPPAGVLAADLAVDKLRRIQATRSTVPLHDAAPVAAQVGGTDGSRDAVGQAHRNTGGPGLGHDLA